MGLVGKDLAAVTPESVAARVGVSPNTFRNYFFSREEAIVEAIIPRVESIAETLRARGKRMSAPQLPLARPNPLTVAPLYQLLRREAPLVRVTTPAGDPAWLVLAYDEAKQIFGDPSSVRWSRSSASCAARS